MVTQEQTSPPIVKAVGALLKIWSRSKKKDVVKVSDYLDEDLIFFVEEKKRDDLLYKLVSHLHEKKKLKNKEPFYKAILEREKIVSTGIGMGVAIPHAKLKEVPEFFIAVGIQKEGVEWNALDDKPVQLVFMIAGPDNRQTEYIQILSSLTYALKQEGVKEKILQAKSPSQVLSLLQDSSV